MIRGLGGDDQLLSGSLDDRLTGGDGTDTFDCGGGSGDRVTDFDSATETQTDCEQT